MPDVTSTAVTLKMSQRLSFLEILMIKKKSKKSEFFQTIVSSFLFMLFLKPKLVQKEKNYAPRVMNNEYCISFND